MQPEEKQLIRKWLEKHGIWAKVWFEVKEEYKDMFCLFEEDYEGLLKERV